LAFLIWLPDLDMEDGSVKNWGVLGQCYHHYVFSIDTTLTKPKNAHFGTIVHLKHLSRISYSYLHVVADEVMGSICKQVAGISNDGDSQIVC
jgi:uncharacterized metal-binding protein